MRGGGGLVLRVNYSVSETYSNSQYVLRVESVCCWQIRHEMCKKEQSKMTPRFLTWGTVEGAVWGEDMQSKIKILSSAREVWDIHVEMSVCSKIDGSGLKRGVQLEMWGLSAHRWCLNLALRTARGEIKRPWPEPWGVHCSLEEESAEEPEDEGQCSWRKVSRVPGAKRRKYKV